MPMTNVFVHYKASPESSETTNAELLFSRVPVAGEIVFINAKTYAVCRVDHHPERNPKPGDEMKAYPEDVEVWLVQTDVPTVPAELA
jgi:hypothetical protein